MSTVPVGSVSAAVKRRLGIQTDEGAFVLEVSPGSGADAAGLQEGDVIVAVDGETLHGDDRPGDLIRQHEPGDMIEVTIERGGEQQTINAELGRTGG